MVPLMANTTPHPPYSEMEDAMEDLLAPTRIPRSLDGTNGRNARTLRS